MNEQDLGLALCFSIKIIVWGGNTKDLKGCFPDVCVPTHTVVISALVSEASVYKRRQLMLRLVTGTENKVMGECLALDGTSRAPLPRPREHHGRLSEKNRTVGGWQGVMWNMVSRTEHGCFTCEHIATVVTCTRWACQHPTLHGEGLRRHSSYSLENYATGSQ